MIKGLLQKAGFSLALLFLSLSMNAQCPTGDLILSSQAQINQFGISYPNCTVINGNLAILGVGTTDIVDLSPLASITAITGGVSISNCILLTNLNGLNNLATVGQYLNIANNAIISMNGLNALTSVGLNFIIKNNSSLLNLNGLDNLTTIQGPFSIQDNTALANLDGLHSLTNIGWNLIINNNDSLTNVNDLSNLTNITGALDIQNNAALADLSGFSSLTNIGDFLQIAENDALVSLAGLNTLTSIGKSFNIWGNPILQNVDGLTGLNSLGGVYIQHNNLLTDLDGLINVTTMDNDWIYIIGNPSLIDISGLQNIDINSPSLQTGVFLHILNNPNLAVCNLPNFCTYLANAERPRDISGNLAGCSDVAAVIASCSLGTDENQLNEVKFYPNPVKTVLTIQNQELVTKLIISDLSGKIIKEHNGYIPQINVEDLSSGMYILQIFSGDKKISNKFVKQ